MVSHRQRCLLDGRRLTRSIRMEFSGKLRTRACHHRLPIRRQTQHGSMTRLLSATSTSTWDPSLFLKRGGHNSRSGITSIWKAALTAAYWRFHRSILTTVHSPTLPTQPLAAVSRRAAITRSSPLELAVPSLAATHGAATLAASSRRQ